MKIINLNFGVKNYMKVESHSAVIDATFAVAKRKKEFRLVQDLNPWPLQYQCNALTNWANKPTGRRLLYVNSGVN